MEVWPAKLEPLGPESRTQETPAATKVEVRAAKKAPRGPKTSQRARTDAKKIDKMRFFLKSMKNLCKTSTF